MSHSSPESTGLPEFGTNVWLVDEIYQQYLADKNSVDPAWWDFFADYSPGEATPAEGRTEPLPETEASVVTQQAAGDRKSVG